MSRLSRKLLPKDHDPSVVAARVCGPYSVFVVFDDGVSKQVNLERYLKGPIYEPVREPKGFAKLRVDHELGTIVWPNGADFAPDTLYVLPDERGDAAQPATLVRKAGRRSKSAARGRTSSRSRRK
jgi:hypothetical protein